MVNIFPITIHSEHSEASAVHAPEEPIAQYTPRGAT
jgi:hypothetical protein